MSNYRTNMLKETLRIIAVLLLLIVAIADDFPFYSKMKDPKTQFVLAIITIGFILYDSIFGFIMGLVLMLIYYEIYKKVKNIKKIKTSENTTENSQKITPVMMDYITNDHLLSAQNNVVHENNYNTEVKGLLKGFNNEGMYSAQGMDKENLSKAGYDYNDKYFSYE